MVEKAAAFVSVLAAAVLPVGAAAAATIYNDLVVDVTVVGSTASPPDHMIVVPAGTHSRDLRWTDAHGLEVVYEGVPRPRAPLCHFYWGDDPSRLQGGNYLVIASRRRDVTCNLCNSGGRLVEFDFGGLPQSVSSYDSPERKCDTGD